MCFRHAPLLDAVRARIAADPALASRVRLLGEIPYAEIELHYQAADFLVQASHVEGSGGALIDALACGTTPLVTDIPSFRSITADGACGALVPVGNAAALAGAIRDWCGRDRPALRYRRARALRARAVVRRHRPPVVRLDESMRSSVGAAPWHVRPYRPGDERTLVTLWIASLRAADVGGALALEGQGTTSRPWKTSASRSLKTIDRFVSSSESPAPRSCWARRAS